MIPSIIEENETDGRKLLNLLRGEEARFTVKEK
jgi:hypothetical protein